MITGGIQLQGNKIRINVHLIHTLTLEQLWSQVYDRELSESNLFEVEDEVVKMIINQVETIFGTGKKLSQRYLQLRLPEPA